MSLLLMLEQGPRPQAVQQTSLDQGELVIGRSASADWQIDDPDMYVSRAHCTISAGDDGYYVTDTSSSGLFIDDAHEPLGAGNSTRLRNGMRLRLGDYVVSVGLQNHAEAQRVSHNDATASSSAVRFDEDDFFSMRTEEQPKPARPASLPNPFDEPPVFATADHRENKPSSPAFDDPFSLDPVATPRPERQTSGMFDEHPAPVARAAQPATRPLADAPSDDALRAAFLRGVGIDPADVQSEDALAEMERFGREYRRMMEGLMQLLRKRAEEKGNARVAQTVVGSSQVNPLKFLPTVDDALTMILADRSPGFLEGEPAITDAIRDLAEHHVRAWRGVQAALRRMVDRFDPAAIEQELEAGSTLENLLAGGRNAKLWELYRKRHKEISQNAESRFLGEVGADFRDAYEEE